VRERIVLKTDEVATLKIRTEMSYLPQEHTGLCIVTTWIVIFEFVLRRVRWLCFGPKIFG
jgi:hypothetical protein